MADQSRDQRLQALDRVRAAIRRLEDNEHVPRSVLCGCGETIPLARFRPTVARRVEAACDGCGEVMTLHVGR